MDIALLICLITLAIMIIIAAILTLKDLKRKHTAYEKQITLEESGYIKNDFTGINYSNKDPIIIERPKENKEPEYKNPKRYSVENDFTGIKYSNRDPIIIERQHTKPGTVAEEQQKQSATTSKTLSYSEQYEAWINAPKEPKALPYKQKALLTPTEFYFYRYLRAICEHFYMRVCPKVRMEDFIEVTTRKEKMKYRGYIKSRHVDYLITDRDFKIICAIELDDPSHNTKEAQKTDEMKNEIYKTIGLPLYRVRTSEDYKERVKEIMRYCIGIMKEWHGKKIDTADTTGKN